MREIIQTFRILQEINENKILNIYKESIGPEWTFLKKRPKLGVRGVSGMANHVVKKFLFISKILPLQAPLWKSVVFGDFLILPLVVEIMFYRFDEQLTYAVLTFFKYFLSYFFNFLWIFFTTLHYTDTTTPARYYHTTKVPQWLLDRNYFLKWVQKLNKNTKIRLWRTNVRVLQNLGHESMSAKPMFLILKVY